MSIQVSTPQSLCVGGTEVSQEKDFSRMMIFDEMPRIRSTRK